MNNKKFTKYYIIFVIVAVIFVTITFSYIGLTYEFDNSFSGDSMEPILTEGDFIISKNVDSIDEVEEGDIISFEQNTCTDAFSKNIIHKVVDETDEGLITYSTKYNQTDQSLHNNGTVRNDSCINAINDEMIKSKVVYHSDDDLFNERIRTIISYFEI